MYRILVSMLIVLIIMGNGASMELSQGSGKVLLKKGLYTISIDNRTTASFSINYTSLYFYKIIITKNFVVVVLKNSNDFNVSLLYLSLSEVSIGSNSYIMKSEIEVNHECPRSSFGWVKGPEGYPLAVSVEKEDGRCLIDLSSGAFPLSPDSWAVFTFYWKRGVQAVMMFGPLSKGHESFSTRTNISNLTSKSSTSLPAQSVISLTNNSFNKGSLKEEELKMISSIALGLSLFTLLISVVSEIGGKRGDK